MKLIRTIRLDLSDAFVFPRAAEPGEWAVPGGFVWYGEDPERLEGKARSAFRAGFVGLTSLGWSTLVQVVDATDSERDTAMEMLGGHLVSRFRAPDIATARAAAEEEIAFAASIAEHPAGTLLALHRRWEDGSVHEQFRTLRPREGGRPFRAFSFLEVEGEEAAEAGEEIALVKLAKAERP